MSDISKIRLNDTRYSIKDQTARQIANAALPAKDYTAETILSKLKTADDDLKDLMNKILSEGVENAAVKSVSDVTLTTSGWTGSSSPYSQTVNVSGVTENSLLYVTPSADVTTSDIVKSCTVFASGQAMGKVTFQTKKKPASNLAYTIVNAGEVL